MTIACLPCQPQIHRVTSWPAAWEQALRRGRDSIAGDPLSKSPNAKLIVLGDKTGLPIIFNDKVVGRFTRSSAVRDYSRRNTRAALR